MTLAPGSATTRPTTTDASAGPAVALAVLITGTLWHVASYANTDIAWLLTVGEHMLDGAVPYRDIIETNPPGSVLLYLPAVLLARALGADPQTIVMLLTGVASAGTLAACAALLRPLVSATLGGPLLAVMAVVLVILPAGSFGQREHIILMALLPLLCRLAVRCSGGPAPPLWSGLGIAVAAGAGLAIKPYYGLGLAGPALMLWHATGWRGMRRADELWLTGLVAALLLGAQLLLFPAFTHDVLPLLTRVYVPMRLPLPDLLTLTGGATALSALIAYPLARRLTPPGASAGDCLPDMAALAALGFFAAYLLQGKGWAYHAYPGVALSLTAIAIRLSEAGAQVAAAGLQACRVAAVLLAGWAAVGLDRHSDMDRVAPGLVDAVSALGPHPRVMSLASDLAVGHPLVRRVQGRWVGTLMASWIDLYVDRIAPGTGRTGPLAAALAFEARTMASDIRDRHPDAVLADVEDWPAWIATKPEVADALKAYHLSGTYGSVMLWTPKPGV